MTAGSALMFPRSYIFFGVLHGIAVMLIVVRLTSGWGRWLWLLGAVAILLPTVAAQLHAVMPALDPFNRPPLHWLGLVSRKPITEDYVPLVPWLGVVWWGMASGRWLLSRHREVITGPLAPAASPLAWLGRWSLTWYMVHQPVLIGALTVLQMLRHASA
ncbi:MAG: hypothetical protein NVS2B4_03740 [Ramlibacter sp.]